MPNFEKLKIFFKANGGTFLKAKSIVFLNNKISKSDLCFLKNFLKEFPSLIKIAADGAANQLIKNHIIPNYIIGDLDSTKDEKHKEIKYIKINDQYSCDFEKCLNFCETSNLLPSFIFSINGGYLDRTMYNMHIFTKFQNHLNIGLSKETIFFSLNNLECGEQNESRLFIKNHSKISLMGFSDNAMPAAAETTGLKWNLSKEFKMDFGFQNQSACNRVFDENLTISDFVEIKTKILNGRILCFLYLKDVN